MQLKPYPEYKESGIQWIGKIPEGWELHRLKFLLKIPVTDGPHETPEFIEGGIPFLSVDSIQDGKLIFDNCRYISEEDHIRFKAKCNPKKDDVFLGKAASIGKIAIVDVNFEFSIWSPLALLRPNKKILLPKFLEYSLKSNTSQYQIEIFATSNTQKNISMDDIPQIQLMIPPLPDQTAIANFLDKKTAKIDTLIEKDKKLIRLLKEKRAALINHCVTKGLAPNVKMKDSGIPWIGEIPEGWEVRKLKYIGKSIIGLTYSPDEISDNKGILVLRASNIKNNKINLTDKVYVDKNIPKEKLTYMGDILICSRSGSKALIGKNACIYKNNTGYSFGVFTTVFRTKYWKFISYVFNSIIFYSQLNSCLTTTINQLTIESLNNILVLFPDISMQNYIIDILNKETGMIDKTIQKINKKIKLLEEHKKSLIHYVVTGKVDVRGVEV